MERDTVNNPKTEQANLRNVTHWEAERRHRVDGYAAALTHLAAALDALPREDAGPIASAIAHQMQACRGSLRRALDETNPFAGEQASPSMRALAACIVRDADRVGWKGSASALVRREASILSTEQRAQLVRLIEQKRGN